jgi:hypothetical protein
MLNDFQVDSKGQYIYIADTSILGGTPALVVFSIAERRSHRVLASHPSMFGSSFFFNVGSVPIRLGPFAVKVRHPHFHVPFGTIRRSTSLLLD